VPDQPRMPKSPPELISLFTEVLATYPDAEQRKMFGYPAAFVGGNLATSLFSDRWIVRLPAADAAAAIEAGASPFEPMAGRRMKGFVLIPREDVADNAALRGWVERGLATAAVLPAKG
jgi:TfoX-like protein